MSESTVSITIQLSRTLQFSILNEAFRLNLVPFPKEEEGLT